MCRCHRLFLALPRRLPLQYRLLLRRLHHRRLSPLLCRHPHHLRHHRLYLCRTPRLRSSLALAVNWRMRDTWRSPGGRVVRSVQCAMHHGNTPIAIIYNLTMRPWCQCWARMKLYTKSNANMAPLRTCRPRVHQTCTLRQAFLRRIRHRTRKYVDTQ